MPKPVCVNCQCFYRPKQNGFKLIEGMPKGDHDENIRGKRKPEAWEPYKVWQADLWECPDCFNEIVVGFGHRPTAEHYEPHFKKEAMGVWLTVNDC